MAKMKASLKDMIETGLAGRTQTYILKELRKKGVKISDSQFSRKKRGHETFKEAELEALSEILNIQLT